MALVGGGVHTRLGGANGSVSWSGQKETCADEMSNTQGRGLGMANPRDAAGCERASRAGLTSVARLGGERIAFSCYRRVRGLISVSLSDCECRKDLTEISASCRPLPRGPVPEYKRVVAGGVGEGGRGRRRWTSRLPGAGGDADGRWRGAGGCPVFKRDERGRSIAGRGLWK